jgi:DNA-binding protein
MAGPLVRREILCLPQGYKLPSTHDYGLFLDDATEREPGLCGQEASDERTLRNPSNPVSYVLACLSRFQEGAGEVTLKARGRAISTAVDTAQVLTKRFLQDVTVKKIEIGTEQVKSIQTGEMNNVSSITIYLSKAKS